VNPLELRIRRATVDDLPALKVIWFSMRLDADALENRLTEFQVVERGGEVIGAIGFQISRAAGRLHSEGYSDFSVADPARELFWDRIQKLAASHGVFRLWTQEDSPFWPHQDFLTPDEEGLTRLPEEWKNFEGRWLTLELKNEAVINAAYKTQLAKFTAAEKKSAGEIEDRARTLRLAVTIGGFLIFFACLAFAGWWFTHHRR
jgi:N-acetylglutamate synthase-like GNAT family acetyltransferase